MKTPLQSVNAINTVIDEVLKEGSLNYVNYSSDGVGEVVTLETDVLLCSEMNKLFDQNDSPMDPEEIIVRKLISVISDLEKVKAVLLDKYPPKPPLNASVDDSDDCAREAAEADAAASHIAGEVLRVAGSTGARLPS